MKLSKINLLFCAGITVLALSSCGIKKDLAMINNKLNQLAVDDDQDGIPNIHDRDNATPPESMVYGNGTAVDTDHDGVPDYKDSEVFSPYGAKVDANGKAFDTDGDGVPDVLDIEPNSPKGAIVTANGKAITFAAISEASGEKAPVAQVAKSNEGNKSAASITSSIVFFPINSSVVQQDEQQKIVNIALYLKSNPSATVTVVGYSDQLGSEKYNIKVSKNRAQAVAKLLIENFQVDKTKIKVDGKGKAEPIAYKKLSNYNRRVEFIIE